MIFALQQLPTSMGGLQDPLPCRTWQFIPLAALVIAVCGSRRVACGGTAASHWPYARSDRGEKTRKIRTTPHDQSHFSDAMRNVQGSKEPGVRR